MADASEQLIFVYHYPHTIDSQRRVAIPSDWRSKSGEMSFYLLPAKEHVLQLIPAPTFYDQVILKAQRLPLSEAGMMRDLAICAARAQKCVCDKQGRIQLSQEALNHANLKDKAILVGAFWHIQIWSPDAWELSQKTVDSDEHYNVMKRINEIPEGIGK